MSVHSGGFFSSIVTVPYSFMSHSLLYWPVHARLSVSVDERKKKRARSETASERKMVGRLFRCSIHGCLTSMHIACVSSCLFGLNPKIQWLSCTQGQTKLTYWTSFNVEFIRIMFTCQNIGAISLTPYFRQNNFSAGVSSFRIGQIYIMFRMCKFLSAIGLEDKFQSHLPLKIKIEENRKYAAGTVFVH